jgi:hypothetical protein
MRVPALLPVQAVAGFTKVRHQTEGRDPQIPRSASPKGQDFASIQHRRTCQKKLRAKVAAVNGSVGGLMQDLMWVVITILFFAVSIGYVEFCDRVK